MPKAKPGMTPAEQKKRFIADAQRMIDDGLLNPTDADTAMDAALRNGARLNPSDNGKAGQNDP